MRHLLLLIVLALLATFTSAQVQFLGSPTTTVRNRGNFVSDSLFYLPKRQKLPSDTGAIRYAIADSSVYVWSGYQWSKLGASIDTTIISTRAWRKKGDDSLGAVIATKVNISDTATMLNPYTRGSGTVNALPLFVGTRTLGNSQVLDSAAAGVSIGTKTLIRTDGPFITGANISGRTNPIALGTRGVHPIHFYTSDAERLRIFANGRVGVNTTTDAGYQFDVAGSMRNTTGAAFATSSGGVLISSSSFVDANDKLQIENTIDGPYGIRLINQSTNSAATSRIVFGTQGGNYTIEGLRNGNELRYVRGTTEAMRINSSGNVGINLTAPDSRFHSQIDTIALTAANLANGSALAAQFTYPDVAINANNGIGISLGMNDRGRSYITSTHAGTNKDQTSLAFWTTNGGTITEKARITQSGELLILGTANPLAGTNRGNITLNGTGSNILGFTNGTTTTGFLFHTGTDLQLQNSTATGVMQFLTNSAERMRITSDGELLINTTTDVGDYRLQVNGNANFRDDVLIDTNLRVNRHISLDQTPKAWALGNAIEGPQGSTLFVAGGGVQTLANVYYDGSYKYSTSNPGAAMFLLQSGITFATYGSGTANNALTGANEMVYAGGELRVGIADQGTFKLQVADKSYLADEVQIASTTDLGNYKLQVTGEAIITAGIRTDAPSGGTAATWKLGTVATVSPTSPNRTIEVEIGGTTYYIHAKTTNN